MADGSRPATGCGPAATTRRTTPGCPATSAAPSGRSSSPGRPPARRRPRARPAAPAQPVYTVRFAAAELFGAGRPRVTVDVWEAHLQPGGGRMSGDHHGPRASLAARVRRVEAAAGGSAAWSTRSSSTARSPPSSPAASPANGGRVVARAWLDAGFRERLLADANAALPELGLSMGGGLQEQRLKVVENTAAGPQRHRLHAVLLLPDRPARPVTDLVQERGLPRRASCASRARSSQEFGFDARPARSRSPCGTRARSRATWSSRAGRPARRTSTRRRSPALVTRNGLIGVAPV